MTDIMLQGLFTLLGVEHLFFLFLGTMLGLVVGILPGLGGIAGLSLLLPFVYGMDPTLALPMMVGLLAVTTTSDTFPSVLMGIPGTSGSQATVVDGFPLAKRGEAARALGAAFSASLFGGLVGALILTLTVYVARPLILAVGFGEQLMLIVLALTMVGMLTGTSALKGLAACGLGLLLGSVGAAPATGEYRLTFDTIYLSDGVPLVVVGLAMFAVPEIVDVLRRRRTISGTAALGSGWLRGFWETLHHKWLVLRCSSIGTLIGALPGLGGSVVDWIAYGHLAQTTRDRQMLGKGDIRGVIAPESANNAKEGGALMPTLFFGIPGSGSMAVLIGGLILIGVEPGIGMIERHLDLTYLIVWSLALANVIGAGTCLLLARPIAHLTLVRYTLLAPFMIAIIYFAVYQATRSWYDLIALFVLGLLGMYMKRFGWSRPALLIGFVLSMRLDAAVYQSLQVYGTSFLQRPGVLILIGLIVISVLLAVRMKPHRPALTPEGPHGASRKAPQMIFLGVMAACVGYALFDAFQRTFLAQVFPTIVALLTLAMIGAMALFSLRRRPDYVFYDADREGAGEERPARGELHYQGWMLGLLGSIAVLGFVLGIVAYIAVFLRVKAQVAWHWAVASASGAAVVLAILSHVLVLHYPEGILQLAVDMPWPFN
jgi:putative tricarboxylic transport membrane protein